MTAADASDVDEGDAWAAATFAGTQAAQRRRAASSTVEQRLAWLDDVLREAERTGVLARVRARRQAEATALWEGRATTGPA